MADAAIIPPITVEPRTRRATAPEPVANQSGKQSKDESKGRHQDRSQTQTRAFERGVEQRLALFVFVLGELDDQDRVFRGQTDEHDQPDLRVDVVLHSAQPECEERAEHRDRGA